jgi:DNA-binding IclR family transcriptional regulator
MNRSAARAIDIIDLVAESKESMTITEISKILDMPKSTAFDLVYTLVNKGYLEATDSKNKTFGLGLRLFQAGARYLEKTNFYDIAHPVLEEIMRKTNETVFLALENNGRLVYLDKVETTSSVRTYCQIGSNHPMYHAGLGKAILAAFSEEQVREIIKEEDLIAKTQYTITTLDGLFKELDETRKRGYAIDNREGEIEVFCVAAPIYNAMGKAFAGISIASMVSRMEADPGRVERFGKLIAENAFSISKRIGFRGDTLYKV